ncbi:cupin domain-containing protein [Nonomuraea jiangxiensis]|uniref:Cupin domain-containing protein n=1 Tax=Nonomuraea jiangxiensis TaxID=633440 RepID=A0A1G8T9X8_9ACTN|nr:cupin domain-containing protein [Nonomuraea jiangxiensis]SDJ38273.1 Cupin domain-containing protein [Nonomuraea jiangxiensis]
MTDIGLSGEPFWFLGGRTRILVPGEATGRSMSVLMFDDAQGQAPPLHVHDGEDELWIVLDGEISFFVGDARHDLAAGQVAHGPRGVPHSYLVRSPRSRMAVVYAPSGIEEWFRTNGSPVSSMDEAPPAFDLGAIVASAETFRLHVAGPPPSA